MLLPMIIFRGKTVQAICNLIIPPGYIVNTLEKAWIGYNLIKIWVEEIWLKNTQAECKRPGFQNSVLSFDDFAAHLTDGVKIQLLEGNSNIFAVPASSTSKCQPMGVCLNKPFKAILRKCSVKYVQVLPKVLRKHAINNSSFKLPVQTRRYMTDWVKEGFNHLVERSEMVKRSFEVCSISSSDSLKVHNASFY